MVLVDGEIIATEVVLAETRRRNTPPSHSKWTAWCAHHLQRRLRFQSPDYFGLLVDTLHPRNLFSEVRTVGVESYSLHRRRHDTAT